jgi:hypothetical protein
MLITHPGNLDVRIGYRHSTGATKHRKCRAQLQTYLIAYKSTRAALARLNFRGGLVREPRARIGSCREHQTGDFGCGNVGEAAHHRALYESPLPCVAVARSECAAGTPKCGRVHVPLT